MIHTSLSPNTQSDDVWLTFFLRFQPWRWTKGNAPKELENRIGSFIGVPHVVTVDSGRTALYTILKALGIGSGDEVLLQAYTCVAVPEPVLWVGAKPVYVDCTDEFVMNVADLEKKINKRSKVIIAQHTFGKAADMDAIMAVAKKYNLFVIEDCAHSLGGTYKGKKLGSIGDAAFFSFGRDKVISSVFGGAIATKNNTLFEKIKTIVGSYPMPSSWWIDQQLNHPIILTKVKITYNWLSLGKIILEVSKRLHLISKAVEKIELSGGMPNFALHQYAPGLAELALHQFNKLSLLNDHRKEIARLYSEKLPGVPKYDDNHVYLRYTLTLTGNISPKEMMKKGREHGIHFGDWYTTVLAPKGVNYSAVGYRAGSCPKAEYLADHTINLPTHIGITPAMAKKITDCTYV